MKTLASIRTDVVGSLLRPARWREAREAFERGALAPDRFAAVERECIAALLRMQEDAGLDVVTDGEISRLNFQDSVGASLRGFDAPAATVKEVTFRSEGAAPMQRWNIPNLYGVGPAIQSRRPVVERLSLGRNVPLAEFTRAAPLASRPVKVTLVGPDRVAQRFAHEASKSVYADTEAFMADLVAVLRQMIGQLVDAGCRYVHIDEPGYTAYVDAPSLVLRRQRGEDPDLNMRRSIAPNAAIVAAFPDVTFGVHLCRGNHRSMWHREGSYDAIAERLFNQLPFDRFLLEYDSPRAGSFEPLRFVPRDKIVVLGLVSSKVAGLESADDLCRRIDAAARYIPLDQLAISPQCGFASDIVGNLLDEAAQRRKLELVVRVAERMWGRASGATDAAAQRQHV
jgi:5-methyltetrahydropteroyltriglutamate--homocysteine methyltransferase